MFGENFFDEEISSCEFCGMNLEVFDDHRPECPVNFIPRENFELIMDQEEEIYQDLIRNGDVAKNIGMQLLMISDLIISSQKRWQNKSLMAKFDELLNKYSDLTDFIEALVNAGVLLEVQDVVAFIKDPSQYDDLFSVWIEHGQPNNADEDAWLFFVSMVNSNGWKKNESS